MNFFKKNKLMLGLIIFIFGMIVVLALNADGGGLRSGVASPVPTSDRVIEDADNPASTKPVSTPQNFSVTGLPPKTDAPAPTAAQPQLATETSPGTAAPAPIASASQATETLPGTDTDSMLATPQNQLTEAPAGAAAPMLSTPTKQPQPAEATPPKNAPPPPTPKNQLTEAPPPGNGGPPSP